MKKLLAGVHDKSPIPFSFGEGWDEAIKGTFVMRPLAALLCCCLSTAYCSGQLPDSDIWILDIKDSAEEIVFSNAINITHRNGYDNQPVFSPDSKFILYSSQPDNGQTDIFKYVIKSKVTTQFTNTPTSEYSPGFMPDGRNVSVVMVEKDSVQRLWHMPVKGVPRLIMKLVDSIGYYSWINKDSILLYILTKPPTLQVTNIKIQQPAIVAKNAGRCIQQVPSPTGTGWEKVWVFSEKFSDTQLKLMSLYYHKKRKLKASPWCSACNLPGKVEDFALSRFGVLTAQDSKIYNLQEEDNAVWKEISDLNAFGISNITRIAVSPDGKKLAVVANK